MEVRGKHRASLGMDLGRVEDSRDHRGDGTREGPAYLRPISSQITRSFWSTPIALFSCCYITLERKWGCVKQVSGLGRSSG